jgi:hypothetical protein
MDDIRPAVRGDDLRSNDGAVRVLVPPEEEPSPRARRPGRRQAGRSGGYTVEDSLLIIRDVIREAIRALTEQLDIANRRADAERERADRAQQRADDERARADLAERRVKQLEAALDEKSSSLAAVLADLRPASPGRRRRWWRWRRR